MQNAWLTQTKFVPPRLRDDFVPRIRLVDTLHSVVNSSALTLLFAPAGYGKTTLLASLSDKPVARISFDEEENDLDRFCIALVLALRKLDANFGENTQALFSSWDTNCPIPYIYRYTLQQER